MARKYFGTDGVRGRVGDAPMTVDFALRLASAAARVLAPEGGRVVIGKDTRLSGYLFEAALEAGFVAAGVDVLRRASRISPAACRVPSAWSSALRTIPTRTTASSSSTAAAGSCRTNWKSASNRRWTAA
jgi:phosphoglucomutase